MAGPVRGPGRECGQKEEVVPDLRVYSGRSVCGGEVAKGQKNKNKQNNFSVV